MAAIDHTCIVFRNGEYIPEHLTYRYDENDRYINLLPFKHNRDGMIHTVEDPFGSMVNVWLDTKWYHDEYDAIYQRAGWKYLSSVRKTPYGIWSWLKYKLHIMERIGYRKEVGVCIRGDTEVYIFHDDLKQCYVSFYSDNQETYVVIGGYGHWENVYCHFMGRGYGDEVESYVAQEAYLWACDKVLVNISESICDGSWEEEEAFVNIMRKRFGYKEPYKIVCRSDDEDV